MPGGATQQRCGCAVYCDGSRVIKSYKGCCSSNELDLLQLSIMSTEDGARSQEGLS